MLRLIALLLAFILLCYWCVTRHSPMIEHDVLSHAQSTLLAENTNTIVATIDGRDILLTGQVDTDDERQNIINSIRNTKGVRVVDHTLGLTPKAFPVETTEITPSMPDPTIEETATEVEPVAIEETPSEPVPVEKAEPDIEPTYIDPGLPLTQLAMNITKNKNAITLNGYLPDEASKDSLLNQISNKFTVKDNINITALDGNWPNNWSLLSSAVLSQLMNLSQGTATIKPGQVTINGLADNHNIRDSIEKILHQSLPSSWVMNFNIDIPLSDATIACETEIQNILNKGKINFKLESTKINNASTALLDSMIDNFQACTAASFLIEGHTDNIGSEEYNIKLSEERAQAIKDYLVSKGIDANRIKIKGYGESRPIADNSTVNGRSQNRRIEFVVLGESL